MMVRELIGPIASFRLSVAISALPRTRSGKTCRKSISDLARNKTVKVPTKQIKYNVVSFICTNLFSQISATVEDPSVYKDIKLTLQKVGYALSAPDPQ